MSEPAPPCGSPALPPPSPLRQGVRAAGLAAGAVVALGLVVYAAWLAVVALSAVDAAAKRVGGAAAPAQIAPGQIAPSHIPATPPAAARPVTPTPHGITMAFDQLWTGSNGNTIVAGMPTVGVSPQTGQRVIQVAVTLINNTQQDWNPMSIAFSGTLNQAPVAESAEGDWMYRTPIVAHTSVTLNKIFVGGSGQFSLTVSTQHGVAVFTGRV